MIATAPRKLGRFELHCLSDGHWRMDGGSVFGVVPKVLWERKKPAAIPAAHPVSNAKVVTLPEDFGIAELVTTLEERGLALHVVPTAPGRVEDGAYLCRTPLLLS